MSLLYLHFESDERAGRVTKLARSGAHIIVSEPRWPGFWELAKREKPIAVAVERAGRVTKLARSGAHIIVSEPRWPGFWELAKREKPIAVAVDFSHAPSHAL